MKIRIDTRDVGLKRPIFITPTHKIVRLIVSANRAMARYDTISEGMSDDEVIEIMYEAMQKPLDALTDILGLSEKERDTLDSLPAEKFTQFVSYVTTMIWTNGKGRDEEVKPEKSQPAKKTIRAGRHARRS